MRSEGDAVARFEAAFAADDRRVLAYAVRRTATAEDAEDVTAETFAIAWRRRELLPGVDDALPWLFGIARRVAANHRRGRARWASVLDRLRERDRPPSLSVLSSPAQEALSRMRDDDQELLRLLAWEGLTHAEAAAVLNVSPNAVAIRLHRARKRFAELLALVEKEDAKGPDAVRTPHGMTDRQSGRRSEGPTR